jgi:hypothetical protein
MISGRGTNKWAKNSRVQRSKVTISQSIRRFFIYNQIIIAIDGIKKKIGRIMKFDDSL